MLAPVSLWAKKDYYTDPHILLIRGLDSEIAVAKIPLPAGKKGILINPKGEVDQQRAAGELQQNGMAVKPGTPVEITKIEFRARRIVFQINGGPKKWKWYQHLEIGMGGPGAMTPVGPQQDEAQQTQSIGSSITLQLPPKSGEPTVEQTKQLLSEVLDFHRQAPTVLYSPSVPPQFKEAIKNHQVVVGMNQDAVLSAKGPPDRKVREDHPDGSEEEDWIYGLPPHCLFVVFNGDTVVSVHQYQ